MRIRAAQHLAGAHAWLSLEDPDALIAADPVASGEERFVYLAADAEGRVLVTVHAQRGKPKCRP